MSTTASLNERSWAYQVQGNAVYLYEIDSDNEFVTPLGDVTDGLKVEALVGDKVFVDSSGFEDTDPSETSYLNIPDIYKDALVAFLKYRFSQFTNQIQESEYWYQKFLFYAARAKENRGVAPYIATTRWPYAVR